MPATDTKSARVQLTKNQLSVLTKLARNHSGLRGRDFADLATVTHGKWEWGNPILRALEEMHFVEKSDRKVQGVRVWVITREGLDALPRAEVAKPDVKADAPLTNVMLERLKMICEAHPQPFVTAAGRATETALEARDLITISESGPGWRDLRLTETGIARCNEIFGLKLTTLDNPEEFSYDA